jgi:hypothetical protein
VEVTLVSEECTTFQYWELVVHMEAMVWDMEDQLAM